MFNDVTDEYKIVASQLIDDVSHISNVNVVVEIVVRWGKIGFMAFDAIDLHPPVFALVSAGIFGRIPDVRILAKEEPPLTETGADVKYGSRTPIPN
jgi:hypothetical protein